MRMFNQAIEDAAAFKDLLTKIQRSDTERMQAVCVIDPEREAWNKEVERKRAQKKARKAQHTKALDGLR